MALPLGALPWLGLGISVSAREVKVVHCDLRTGHLSDDRFGLCAWGASSPQTRARQPGHSAPASTVGPPLATAARLVKHPTPTPSVGASHRKPCLFKEKGEKKNFFKIPDTGEIS